MTLDAVITAPPPATTERLAKVPEPKGVKAVSPSITLMSSGGIPRVLCRELREGGQVALALRRLADHQDGVAVRLDREARALDSGDAQQPTGTEPGTALAGLLGDAGNADAAERAGHRARRNARSVRNCS